MNLKEVFDKWCRAQGDLHDHVEFLYHASRGIVLELGVRGGTSTSALLLGAERDGGRLFSVDKNKTCGELFKGHALWHFIHSDSLDRKAIERTIQKAGHQADFDIIFIDTIHTYIQVARELSLWNTRLKHGGKIFVHDVTTYPQGAGAACQSFAQKNNWNYEIREGSNGLGILTRKGESK